MFLLSNTFESFGLDIGDRSLKAAFIKKIRGKPTLLSYGVIEVPPGVLEQGEIKDKNRLLAIIKELLEDKVGGKKITTPYVHACLPEPKTFIKLLSFSNVTEAKLPERIYGELPNHLPLPANALYLDWQMVERQPTGTTRILLGAVPRAVADSYTSCLLAANLSPLSLQVEAEAILRSLLPAKGWQEETLAVIDIGATRSGFICFDKGTIQFTVSLPFSSDSLTELIKNKFNLSAAEAERAKRLCGLSPTIGKGVIAKLLDGAIGELAETVKKNIAYYVEHFAPTAPITSLLLCGGGAQLKNIKSVLEKKLGNIQVNLGNPLLNLNKKHSLIPSPVLPYMTAIGLALSNVNT